MSSKKEIKKSIYDPSLDEMIKDKLNEEQMSTLSEFKQVIYDNEKYKKYNKDDKEWEKFKNGIKNNLSLWILMVIKYYKNFFL